MGSRKRRRARGLPSPPPAVCELPMDIVLEIALRAGDFVTLLRCGATCRSLWRAVHAPGVVRRVREGILQPSRLLGLLDRTGSSFSLAHPSTPAAASLFEDQLAPFVTRAAADVLDEYDAVASRGGLLLLVLERRKRSFIDSWWWRRSTSEPERRPPGICVYDPMTGGQAFLPFPPDILHSQCTYVLLTAADGIGGSFLLLAVDGWDLRDRLMLGVQTVSSDADGRWAPVEYSYHQGLPKGTLPCLGRGSSPVVLDGVVHWLISFPDHVLTYNVGTSAVGSIGLPKDGLLPGDWSAEASCLGSTPDGRLTLVYRQGWFRVCVLVLSAGGGWERRMEVDTETTLRSLLALRGRDRLLWLELESSGDQKTGAVLMQLHAIVDHQAQEQLLVLDMETKQIRFLGDKKSGIRYEVDLVSRLSAAKIF